MRSKERKLAGFSALLAAAVLSAAPPAASGQTVRTVQDSLGRTVSVPERAERILSLQPEISRILIALGAGERLVGVDYFLHRFDHVVPLVFPKARELPLVTRLGEDVNLELVLELKPDLIFVSPSESWLADSLQSKLPLPVAAFASLGNFEVLFREIEFVADLIGRRERGDELVRFARGELAAVRERVEARPPAERPRVYLAFYSSLLRTNVSYEPVGAAGGVNAAARLIPAALGTREATVGIEQILAWDPAFILIQGNYLPDERAVTKASVLGDIRLRSLQAVRTGRVTYTFGFWYWWDPAQVLLETRYLARLFYPEAFPDFDFEAEGNRIYRAVYGADGVFSRIFKDLNCDEWILR
jgi:iron complex transport system substrate-binding protein